MLQCTATWVNTEGRRKWMQEGGREGEMRRGNMRRKIGGKDKRK
jgi:hypothetical protein